ncbi:MAG: hypothetical protein R3346_00245 [Candidatus Spechtbacterales bacterium]|nr:hypothetical protein [Candidatus Spechtbacterales bacterium]
MSDNEPTEIQDDDSQDPDYELVPVSVYLCSNCQDGSVIFFDGNLKFDPAGFIYLGGICGGCGERSEDIAITFPQLSGIYTSVVQRIQIKQALLREMEDDDSGDDSDEDPSTGQYL